MELAFEWDENKARIKGVMKKEPAKPSKVENDDMLPEYDFRKAVRGKHYKPLHEGYSVYIHRADGTTVVEHRKLEEGVVILAPDVRQYFNDSDAVNAALRSLITLMSELPGKSKLFSRKTHEPSAKKRIARNHAKSAKV